MSKTSNALSESDIEEELMNNDLLSSGAVQDVALLNTMSKAEKATLSQQNKIELSSTNFPPLTNTNTPSKNKNSERKRLQLPRKQPFTSKAESLQTDKLEPMPKLYNVKRDRFKLPFCLDDDDLPIPLPERPEAISKSFYCVMKGESAQTALMRMLAHHDRWKAAYLEELKEIVSNETKKVEEDKENEVVTESDAVVTASGEDEDDDPYMFNSNSPNNTIKVYSGPRKRETVNIQNSRQLSALQRKSSRDSDSEELQMDCNQKASEAMNEEIQQASRPKTKRNYKQQCSQDEGKSADDDVEVEFDFDNKWDKHMSGTVSGNQQGGSIRSSVKNNQFRRLPNSPVIETMVECPICTKRFPKSKVENHAADCDVFVDSPMEVEES